MGDHYKSLSSTLMHKSNDLDSVETVKPLIPEKNPLGWVWMGADTVDTN